MSDEDADSGGPFMPDWVSPPGDTLADILDERGMPYDHARQLLGLNVFQFDALIHGDMPIDEALAQKLAEHFGASAKFWVRREAQYQADRVRLGLVT